MNGCKQLPSVCVCVCACVCVCVCTTEGGKARVGPVELPTSCAEFN